MKKHLTDKQISLLIDNELAPNLSLRYNAHCDICAECQKRRDEYLKIKTLVSNLPLVSVNEDHALTRIRARLNEAPPPKAGFNWVIPALAGFATALIAIGVLLFSPINSSESERMYALSQGPIDECVAEQETDEIIRGYSDMKRLYYF